MDNNLALAKSAIARFEDKMSQVSVFDEDLAREYNRARKALAASFQAMALEAVPRERFDLGAVKRAVMVEMRRLFEGRVDSRFFVIRRYTTPHPDVYALLALHVGEPVPGWRVRLLTGDKIHTERRTRELRDLGLAVEVSGSQDDMHYCLSSREADLTFGAAFQLRENASRSKRLGRLERAQAVRLAEQTVELPERKPSK